MTIQCQNFYISQINEVIKQTQAVLREKSSPKTPFVHRKVAVRTTQRKLNLNCKVSQLKVFDNHI